MGGCRCVYRKCQNSTTQSPELHYFHFPVRDSVRCEQWITNARKPLFMALDRNKLRNKVICSLHFEKQCFINENHDRLIHNAVPTLGFEEYDDDNSTQNAMLAGASGDNNDIMLIPLNEDNTKFILPDVGFSGMSYTICNDTLVPSNKINYTTNMLDIKTSQVKSEPQKVFNVKPVIKKIKASFPLRQSFTLSSCQVADATKTKSNAPQKLYLKTLNTQPLHDEAEVMNGKNISTYSMSTLNGDLSLEPSTDSNMSNVSVDKLNVSICDYQTDTSSQLLNESSTPLLDNDISLQLKSNNEYTISVAPTTLPENVSKNDNMLNEDDTSEDSVKNLNQMDMEVNEENPVSRNNETFDVTPEKEYIRMIKSNSKQIKQLKNLVQKQNRINKFILQRKRMPHFKPRSFNKLDLLELIKQYLKPSLVAILKLELLPLDEVVLSDNEEKFITDLYTENPECYNLLKNKWNWNLPSSEKSGDSSTG